MRTLGLDFGASKLLARVIAPAGLGSGTEAEIRKTVQPDLAPEGFMALMEEILVDLVPHSFEAVGLGFPGLVDPWRGIARSSVMLPRWRQVPIADQLTQLCGVPCRVDNDVNTFARAELALRREDGDNSFLFVAIGSGIGGALLLGGKLWQGVTGLAGEVGHISVDQNGPPCPCGSRGCVNLYASGPAMEARLGLAKGGLARGDDCQQTSLDAEIHASARALGVALASAQNLLNLPLIVLGGGVSELGEHFRKQVEVSLRRHAFAEVGASTRVELARCGYGGGATGAALLAREALELPVT